MEKYSRTEQDTDDNVAHAHCMLDNQSYRHALRIRSTYSFITENNGCTYEPQCYVISAFGCLVINETERVYCAVRSDLYLIC